MGVLPVVFRGVTVVGGCAEYKILCHVIFTIFRYYNELFVFGMSTNLDRKEGRQAGLRASLPKLITKF